MALFPAIAARFGGASVLGLLYAAPSVEAFLSTGPLLGNDEAGVAAGLIGVGRSIVVGGPCASSPSASAWPLSQPCAGMTTVAHDDRRF